MSVKVSGAKRQTKSKYCERPKHQTAGYPNYGGPHPVNYLPTARKTATSTSTTRPGISYATITTSNEEETRRIYDIVTMFEK